jgi:lipopolysaccharide transport system ATP-binding protein
LNAVRILQAGADDTTADVDIAREIEFQVSYWILEANKPAFVAIAIKDANGTFVLESSNASHDDEHQLTSTPNADGHYQATCTIPANFLNEGRYTVSVLAGTLPGHTIAQEDAVLSFDVHDTGAMHEEYLGNWAGPIIRPRLPWNTVQKSTEIDGVNC